MTENREKDKKTVKLSDEEAVKELLIKSVFDLWKIVNNITRLRPSKRTHFRVSIFGSARSQPDTTSYKGVKQIAKDLALMGCEIITGGGPGLMQAANEGATEVGAPQGSVGIRVDLPFEQSANPFVTEGYMHETFFSRLHHFSLASDAFIIVSGGIGTTLEAMMVWQLLQVGHLDKDTPLIFVGDMWFDLLEWSEKHLLPGKLVNPEDLKIPYFVHTPEEVIPIIKKYQEKWRNKIP